VDNVTNKISAEEASNTFKNLEPQAQDKDDSELSALLDSLKANDVIISVESANEEPTWEDSYMEVVQENCMLIAGWPVYRWTTKFWGYWGGMGAGWWQESGDSTLEAWLEQLLEVGDLLPEDAEVPRPSDEDAPDQ
jgi:hypothetical protein